MVQFEGPRLRNKRSPLLKNRTYAENIILIGCIAGMLLILPFTIFRFLNGDYLVSLIEGSLMVTMMGIFGYVLKTRKVAGAALLLTALCLLVTVVVVNLKGPAAVYWYYPAALACYCIINVRMASIYNIIGVTLLFPAHEATIEAPPKPKEKESRKLPQKGSGVVLLVEDEAPVRAFAARALRLRGYTVIEAENAEEALTLLEDENMAVDVFVTDVVMPGMDGPTWVRKALIDRPGTRVVFVSGYAEGAFGGSQPVVPNSVFLPKPFSLTQLTETVHGQLH